MKAVNLIPSEQRRARPSGKGSGGAYVIVGVLGALLVMAVAYVLTTNTVNERETKAAEARQEADALEAQASQLGSFTDFASIKEQRLASVMVAAEARFDWERLMRELSLVMPAGSWLQTTSASVTGATDGATDVTATTTTAGPAAPAATLVGCTPKQAEVAKMMLRLRQMHRVTDVKLNESTQEQTSSTDVTVDSCGSLYKFDLTVTFEPVAPVKEAPRGATSVPASLGGGS
jgi:Tfp pilus assembly protein PilN